MRRARLGLLLLLTGIAFGACGGAAASDATAGGFVPLPPALEARFEVRVPPITPDGSPVYLELLDTVTGGSFNGTTVEMQPEGDDLWAASVSQPHGSLLRYRYGLGSPSGSPESTLTGGSVSYRVASLDGATLVRDVVANWGPDPLAAPTGRILGQVTDASTGEPLSEMLVSAGGMLTFTDGQGLFRLEGLPPGEHALTAFSPDGSYLPSTQGAILAGGSTTPADLRLSRSSLVQLTFEVHLPEGTPDNLPIRLAGNIRQLGDLFFPVAGGVQVDAARMPELVRVGANQAIILSQAYAGTDLRYKYTLGDGLWSSERSSEGAFVTRRLIVPGADTVVQDRVASWKAGEGELTFQVSVPGETPSQSNLGLLFNPGVWFEPIPMSRSGESRFSFLLTGPVAFQGSLEYRFCLNLDCVTGGESIPDGASATHTIDLSAGEDPVVYRLAAWAIPQAQAQPGTVVAPEIPPRPGWEVGVELASAHHPSWILGEGRLLDEISALSSTHVILSPVWRLHNSAGFPLMEYDPRIARSKSEVAAFGLQASDHGLSLILHPRLTPETSDSFDWWRASDRDAGWWDVFFEELCSFLLTQATIAEEAGAERIVLGGPEFLPALPGGSLPDGTSSRVPADAAQRWGSILGEMRTLFSGQLAWEQSAAEIDHLPPFADQMDALHVNWALQLGQAPRADVEELQDVAAQHLTDLLEATGKLDLPVILSIAYPSTENALAGCDQPDHPCPQLTLTSPPGSLTAASPAGLSAQAKAINAVLLEAHDLDQVSGFYVNGFNPINAAVDTSTSVRGKPAGDVIWYWYQRLIPTPAGEPR